MLFSNFAVLCFLFVTLVAACPISQETDGLEARWNGKINRNLRVRPTYTNTQTCKKLAHCMALCSKSQSTSCINGRCKCNDPVVNFIGNRFLKSVAAIGNAPITKAIGHLMQGIADVKEVLGTILGTFLGPEAKLALKVALRAIPDTGPSHIDQATKNILLKGF